MLLPVQQALLKKDQTGQGGTGTGSGDRDCSLCWLLSRHFWHLLLSWHACLQHGACTSPAYLFPRLLSPSLPGMSFVLPSVAKRQTRCACLPCPALPAPPPSHYLLLLPLPTSFSISALLLSLSWYFCVRCDLFFSLCTCFLLLSGGGILFSEPALLLGTIPCGWLLAGTGYLGDMGDILSGGFDLLPDSDSGTFPLTLLPQATLLGEGRRRLGWWRDGGSHSATAGKSLQIGRACNTIPRH